MCMFYTQGIESGKHAGGAVNVFQLKWALLQVSGVHFKNQPRPIMLIFSNHFIKGTATGMTMLKVTHSARNVVSSI